MHSPWGRESAGVKEIRLAGGDARSRRTEAVTPDHVGGGERLDVAVLPREVGTEDRALLLLACAYVFGGPVAMRRYSSSVKHVASAESHLQARNDAVPD
jgi:hypothetical protein